MKNLLLTLSIALFIPGCSSLSVNTDYDSKIDFSQLKTYRWHAENTHNEASKKYLTAITDQRIRSAIERQLQAQNLIKSTTGKADFLVNYSIAVEDKTDIHTYNNYNGMYPGYGYRAGYGYYGGGMGMGYASSETQVTHYQQGTLIIDIINPETDQLMWRGAADGRLPKHSNKSEKDALTQKYVSKILLAFPPKEK
ncbi:MAG: DUF4136 domain-containing protein [Methyloprofundus sp.]|nr:DUF4136 domain-containing protein [Methyloprofundus sp.]